MISNWQPIFIESEKGITVSRYKTNYGMSVHTHEFFEIEYVLSGDCRQKIRNESYEFSRGDIALLKVGSTHEFITSNELEILKIMIKPELLPPIYTQHAHEFNPVSLIHLPSNEVRRIENILLMIEKEFNMQNEFFLEVISGYLEVLFTLIVRVNRMSMKEDKKLPLINFRSILSYIENNLNTVTPSSVAIHSGYNIPYFSKLFKKHMGSNLSEYINLRKLEKAQKLLIESNKSIENIGYEVGFNHKSYFYRVFKRYYGVTPEEYRKANEAVKKNNNKSK